MAFPSVERIKDKEKTERLIFLTPYIVHRAEDLEKVTLDEANRTELPTKACSPEDITKHIGAATPAASDVMPSETNTRRAIPVSVEPTWRSAR